eukprot:8211073-Lingulodinium_polyedra.AAC.1
MDEQDLHTAVLSMVNANKFHHNQPSNVPTEEHLQTCAMSRMALPWIHNISAVCAHGKLLWLALLLWLASSLACTASSHWLFTLHWLASSFGLHCIKSLVVHNILAQHEVTGCSLGLHQVTGCSQHEVTGCIAHQYQESMHTRQA